MDFLKKQSLARWTETDGRSLRSLRRGIVTLLIETKTGFSDGKVVGTALGTPEDESLGALDSTPDDTTSGDHLDGMVLGENDGASSVGFRDIVGFSDISGDG